MFSTTLTVVDGYPRSLAEGMRSLVPSLGWSPEKRMLCGSFACVASAIIIRLSTGGVASLRIGRYRYGNRVHNRTVFCRPKPRSCVQ